MVSIISAIDGFFQLDPNIHRLPEKLVENPIIFPHLLLVFYSQLVKIFDLFYEQSDFFCLFFTIHFSNSLLSAFYDFLCLIYCAFHDRIGLFFSSFFDFSGLFLSIFLD